MKLYAFIAMGIILAATVAAEWCDNTDLNRDGVVDMEDKYLFEAWYGTMVCDESNNFCDGTDYTQDGKVSLEDFVFFGQHFGDTDCAPPVPEFSTIAASVAISGALLGFLLLRRK
ncbi:MAG: hypothetical protein V1735_07490 [Nanoarchaeota archaeon]